MNYTHCLKKNCTLFCFCNNLVECQQISIIFGIVTPEYRKSLNRSWALNTSQAWNTSRGSEQIVQTEAGPQIQAGRDPGLEYKPGSTTIVQTIGCARPSLLSEIYRHVTRVTRHVLALPGCNYGCRPTNRSRALNTSRGSDVILLLEAGGFYSRIYGNRQKT